MPKLQLLSDLMPKPEEVKRAREFDGPAGSLSKAEQFVLHVISAELVPEKLQFILYRAQFVDISLDLREQMRTVMSACSQVKGNESIATIFELILTIGNVMNAGTYRGSAAGFTLDSLLKLARARRCG